MHVKNVVKVMNFHSLLRVDKARKKAAMYFSTEEELLRVLKKILLNKNLRLDKKLISPKDDAIILNVYIGNDLGFCGDFNFSLNKELRRDKNYKILIGKKINQYGEDEKILLRQTKEEFFKDFSKLEKIIYEKINNREIKELNVIYNHYYNVNRLEFTRKKIYPIEYSKEEDADYNDDFAMETNLQEMLTNLISLYMCYELKICEMNSYAAENVIREQLTSQSLKKIDEIEEETAKVERKVKKQKDFQKIIENFRKGDEE